MYWIAICASFKFRKLSLLHSGLSVQFHLVYKKQRRNKYGLKVIMHFKKHFFFSTLVCGTTTKKMLWINFASNHDYVNKRIWVWWVPYSAFSWREKKKSISGLYCAANANENRYSISKFQFSAFLARFNTKCVENITPQCIFIQMNFLRNVYVSRGCIIPSNGQSAIGIVGRILVLEHDNLKDRIFKESKTIRINTWESKE